MEDVMKLKEQNNTLKIKICSYRTWIKKNPKEIFDNPLPE